MIATVARFHPFPLEIEGILPPASYPLGWIYFLGVCHSQWVEKKSHMNLTCAFSIRLQFWNFCKLNYVFPTFLCLLLNTFADMGGLNTWVFEIFLSLCILDVFQWTGSRHFPRSEGCLSTLSWLCRPSACSSLWSSLNCHSELLTAIWDAPACMRASEWYLYNTLRLCQICMSFRLNLFFP